MPLKDLYSYDNQAHVKSMYTSDQHCDPMSVLIDVRKPGRPSFIIFSQLTD